MSVRRPNGLILSACALLAWTLIGVSRRMLDAGQRLHRVAWSAPQRPEDPR